MAMANRKFYALQKKSLNTFGITIGLGFKKGRRKAVFLYG